MPAFVVIATKGRAKETSLLLDRLATQTMPPSFTVVVGTNSADIANLDHHPLLTSGRAKALISPHIGLCAQRNVGLNLLVERGDLTADASNTFVAFFDDDFRPASDWIECASTRFSKNDIVGLTGLVLADGIMKGGLTEDRAQSYLDGLLPPDAHWTNTALEQETDCTYGCNMAFAASAATDLRFDENLPLYSWQEDRDYTGQVLSRGRVIAFPRCKGVHLGISGGRTSGLRFGYSQIANILYLIKKGTCAPSAGLRQITRNVLANIVKSALGITSTVDYPGRLRGNLIAASDLLRGRLDPRRITESSFS